MTHTSHHCRTHAPTPPTRSPSRRSIVIALASIAAASPGPVLAKSEASPEDERFIRMVLDEASQGDYAFGCVITREDEVIARGRNLGKTNDDPTAHGEMVANGFASLSYGGHLRWAARCDLIGRKSGHDGCFTAPTASP